MNERHIELVMPAGHVLMVHAYGSGQPLVLLHGFPLDAMIWRPCFQQLVTAGYQVLAPDLRGFGKSSAIDQCVSIGDLADDIEQMRRILLDDHQYILGGLSLGGYVAFEVWKRYGQHLRALILCNTKPQSDSEEARQARIAMAKKAIAQSTWEAVSPMLEKLLSQRTRDQDPATTQLVKNMMSCVPASTVAHIQQAMATRRDFTEELAMIKLPTLIITGEHDPISPPAENQKWAVRIPGSRLEILPGAAHLPQVETPAALCDSMTAFLATIE